MFGDVLEIGSGTWAVDVAGASLPFLCRSALVIFPLLLLQKAAGVVEEEAHQCAVMPVMPIFYRSVMAVLIWW